MFKKIFVLLVVISILASLLSVCGGASADKDAQDLLGELIVKAKHVVNQPGWIHVTENIVYDTDQADRGILSNGKTIPLVQQVNIWYHINESKLVYEYVWIMSSQGGEDVHRISPG